MKVIKVTSCITCPHLSLLESGGFRRCILTEKDIFIEKWEGYKMIPTGLDGFSVLNENYISPDCPLSEFLNEEAAHNLVKGEESVS